MQIPFFEKLEGSRTALLVGCGGGADFLSAIPIAAWLSRKGVRVIIGNVSFHRLADACNDQVGPVGWIVDENCGRLPHFPEKVLQPWLVSKGYAEAFVGYGRCGVTLMRESLQATVERFEVDALVMVDGGTDSVAKGDEFDLSTIEEDAVSVVAGSLIEVPVRLHACLGFGIDAFHGVCHHSFLENTSELIRSGGFLGCAGVVRESREGEAFLEASAILDRELPKRPSIIASSIASALKGDFGDVHPTLRTVGSPMFINPLMTTYWTYDLGKLAQAMGFSESLKSTRTWPDAEAVIRAHHKAVSRRPRLAIPL